MCSVWKRDKRLVVNTLIDLRSCALLPQRRLRCPASYSTSILETREGRLSLAASQISELG
jgi:hypothetical protein